MEGIEKMVAEALKSKFTLRENRVRHEPCPYCGRPFDGRDYKAEMACIKEDLRNLFDETARMCDKIGVLMRSIEV